MTSFDIFIMIKMQNEYDHDGRRDAKVSISCSNYEYNDHDVDVVAR